GRVDQQVKVRGFRIELGEIEAVLQQHAGVQDAVVVVWADERGEKRLVAYVVLKAGQEVLSSELRQHIEAQLPDYMVPQVFVMLAALPLTPNGKVDRKRLPEPEQAQQGMEGNFVAPRTPVEEVLAHIWAQVLGVDRVGGADNFFELGGHSLLATQIISRVNQAFKVEIALRALFEAPTVSDLAQRIESALRDEQRLDVVPLRPVPRGEELALSFTQQRRRFLEQLEPGSPFYNIPAAVRLRGALNSAALATSIAAVVRRHEALRTRFASADGRPVQIIEPALKLELPVTDLREFPVQQREAAFQRLAREEARHSFDLTTGPLLRTSLLRLDEQEHVLLVTMHHIISDGWSVGVLLREIAALYEAFAKGEPAPLAELPIQFADFAQWQRQCLQGDLLTTQLSYWK